jgi:Tol biopolymer transport system component
MGKPINSEQDEIQPSLSQDGLSLIFSRSNGPHGKYESTRTTLTAPWSTPTALPLGPNSSSHEVQPYLSANRLSLYFSSNRDGGSGKYDLWMCRRTSIQEPFGEVVNLGQEVNSSQNDLSLVLTDDELTLYLISNRGTSNRSDQIYKSTRSSVQQSFGVPVVIPFDTKAMGDDPWITPDGLSMYFSANRPQGLGSTDLYESHRTNIDLTFSEPRNLGAIINSPLEDSDCTFSGDGTFLIFQSNRPGSLGNSDLYFSRRKARGLKGD